MNTRITVLDGAMGDELVARAKPSSTGLWSAEALLQEPELVASVHQDYIDAGARVIITNTYSTIPSYLEKAGLEQEYVRLATRAGEIARATADASTEQVTVAGSIPPLSESYRPDMVPAADIARPIYRNLVKALIPFVDVFLCETMSSAEEARNAVAGVSETLQESGDVRPVWASWTLSEQPGEGLRSGQSVAEAMDALAPYPVDAFLFNCTDPAAITAALAQLRELTDKPIGAYPNRCYIPPGWTLDNNVRTEYHDMTSEQFLYHCQQWADLGATMFGGCCGIGPDLIASLAQWAAAQDGQPN